MNQKAEQIALEQAGGEGIISHVEPVSVGIVGIGADPGDTGDDMQPAHQQVKPVNAVVEQQSFHVFLKIESSSASAGASDEGEGFPWVANRLPAPLRP